MVTLRDAHSFQTVSNKLQKKKKNSKRIRNFFLRTIPQVFHMLGSAFTSFMRSFSLESLAIFGAFGHTFLTDWYHIFVCDFKGTLPQGEGGEAGGGVGGEGLPHLVPKEMI